MTERNIPPTVDLELDCGGLKCPLPVLKAAKALRAAPAGAVLRVLATDPLADLDLRHFCAEAGHDFLSGEIVDGALHAYIRRGGVR